MSLLGTLDNTDFHLYTWRGSFLPLHKNMDPKTVLQKESLKVTPTRIAVLSYLYSTKLPCEVDDIFHHVDKEHHDADRVTIYRVLEALSEKGLIKKLEFGEGKYRYEIAGDDHHHLICEKCGKIEDISDCGISRMEKDIKKKKNFVIKRHSLEFYGVCQSCQI